MPLSVWSARIEVPYVRPLSGWNWRTSGSSVCGMSFRQPTAARTGPSTFWLAATFKSDTYAGQHVTAETQSDMRIELIPNQPVIRERICWSTRSWVALLTSVRPQRPMPGSTLTLACSWERRFYRRKYFAVEKKSTDGTLFCCYISKKWTLSCDLKIVCVHGLWQYVLFWAYLFISGF